jgi:hypothetical protein
MQIYFEICLVEQPDTLIHCRCRQQVRKVILNAGHLYFT